MTSRGRPHNVLMACLCLSLSLALSLSLSQKNARTVSWMTYHVLKLKTELILLFASLRTA